MSAARHAAAIWIQAIRAPFFTASIIPVLLGTAIAFFSRADIAWPALPLMLACAVCMHAGTNLVNDYYDFRNGVDRRSSYGSSRVLVDGLLPPRKILAAGYIFFAASIILGLALVAMRGTTLLWLGIASAAAGYLYTGKPLGLKYVGLGDIIVFLFMGPAIVAGTNLALTGALSSLSAWASLPVACLVTAILHANNTRDIASDTAAGIKTIARLLGPGKSKLWYAILVYAAYAGTAVMVLLGILPAAALLPLISVPLAARAVRSMNAAPENDPQSIAMADVQTAQLHLVFGLLYVVSFIGAALLR